MRAWKTERRHRQDKKEAVPKVKIEFMNSSFLALPAGCATFRRLGWAMAKNYS
jgi:hypothetical protein